MSKYLLIILFACTGICFTASGQTEKNSWLIGGNGSANFIRRLGAYNQFDASLSPTIGLFVFNNFTIGASIPLSISAATDYDSYLIGVGPFARYYFGKGRVKFFPEVKIEFNREVHEYEQPLAEYNAIIRNAIYKLSPGITYFITNNFALESVLNFYTVTGKHIQNYSSASIDRQGISFNIGFQFYLPHKQ